MLDFAIIGGGPAGLTAGLYATRGGLKDVVMFELGMPGGAITQSSEVENYPGIAEVVTGMELMEPWPKQCMRFGLQHKMDEVTRISQNTDKTFKIETLSGETFDAKSAVVCTGSTPKRAGVKGEDEFFGRGVSTCATCDGFFYKNKEVAVLGGGDTALEEALYLANIASKVYLVHRRNQFRASPATVERVLKNEKIEIVYNSIVDEIYGSTMGVDGLKVSHKESGEQRDIPVPGVFVFVGHDVNNSVLKQEDGSFLCDVNDYGEVVVDLEMKTSIAGLYCAGDMRNFAPKQVVCASSDGAISALQAIHYVEMLKDNA